MTDWTGEIRLLSAASPRIIVSKIDGILQVVNRSDEFGIVLRVKKRETGETKGDYSIGASSSVVVQIHNSQDCEVSLSGAEFVDVGYRLQTN